MPIEQFWTFHSYQDRDNCIIHRWMMGFKVKAITKIEARFRYLSFVKVWEPVYAKKLNGYDDIWEIRITNQNVQFRPLGCFGPGDGIFTLLIGAIEKDWKFEPRNAPDIAVQRRRSIFDERSLINEYAPFIQDEESDEI